jgi:hypothetical protein
LLAFWFVGTYWIGAIRRAERRAEVDQRSFDERLLAMRRHVGGEGEFSQDLARKFAYNEMILVGANRGRLADRHFQDADEEAVKTLVQARASNVNSPARRIWESASDESRRAMASALESAGPALKECALQVLNEACRRRDLYDPILWPDLDAKVKEVVGSDPSILSERELVNFNTLLITMIFPRMLRVSPGLVFETYYAAWLKRLLSVRLTESSSQRRSAADYWIGDEPPCGYLLDRSPDENRAKHFDVRELQTITTSGEIVSTRDRQDLRLNRFLSQPLTGGEMPAAPVSLSSGFHQVAPIIVQAGLMTANEVLCVENPEVHLHPVLQLDMAEFLVRNAAIGKYMVIETHSDLIVRRVIRAILEEQLPQEAVRIYFTHLTTLSEPTPREAPVVSSTLGPVEIDEQGRIRNWPDGFLDADVRESRRLLDVMYGGPPDDAEDEEEGPE